MYETIGNANLIFNRRNKDMNYDGVINYNAPFLEFSNVTISVVEGEPHQDGNQAIFKC